MRLWIELQMECPVPIILTVEAPRPPSHTGIEMPPIYHTIQSHARHQPEALAILAPGREALHYSGLLEQIDQIINGLNESGIGRNDRVAIVMPNGPEMAVTFLAVIATATAAPLNPHYRTDEFHFYL